MSLTRTIVVTATFVVASLTLSLLPAVAGAIGPSSQADSTPAIAALEDLLAAFSAGNPGDAEALIEPRMIGYSRLVDGLREAVLVQKQIRLTLSDTKTLVADDIALIQTRWEKLYIKYPGLQPVRRSGISTFVMHREKSVWSLSALSGDNPFSVD